jgi:hypothetical protein
MKKPEVENLVTLFLKVVFFGCLDEASEAVIQVDPG